jgi:hypothetical protein
MARLGRSRIVIGFLFIATGAVWIGQGTGFLQGRSFMVGDPTWALIGGIAIVIGVALIATGRRHRP